MKSCVVGNIMEHVEVHIFGSWLQDISKLPAFEGSAWHALDYVCTKCKENIFLQFVVLKIRLSNL